MPVNFEGETLRGSRLLCLVLTGGPQEAFARTMSEIIAPFATIQSERAPWMPRGTQVPEEAQLNKNEEFLSAGLRQALTKWWLKIHIPKRPIGT